ncbi:hypothetical protein [Microbacterium thalassium]|uniref:Uncharacterized protein n=1 Tax=Microbacterium thalassium TaxID=362649 RepID=A0A7X0FS79_9MICO|nr:hypothetical protein [Microbacterium thalassium]MBB6392773.1 hypothetical protein [Microbacterium thalassium]GLK22996.1 hypothetical protein GCM10017607_03140 [Microbacterium thalassium]
MRTDAEGVRTTASRVLAVIAVVAVITVCGVVIGEYSLARDRRIADAEARAQGMATYAAGWQAAYRWERTLATTYVAPVAELVSELGDDPEDDVTALRRALDELVAAGAVQDIGRVRSARRDLHDSLGAFVATVADRVRAVADDADEASDRTRGDVEAQLAVLEDWGYPVRAIRGVHGARAAALAMVRSHDKAVADAEAKAAEAAAAAAAGAGTGSGSGAPGSGGSDPFPDQPWPPTPAEIVVVPLGANVHSCDGDIAGEAHIDMAEGGELVLTYDQPYTYAIGYGFVMVYFCA